MAEVNNEEMTAEMRVFFATVIKLFKGGFREIDFNYEKVDGEKGNLVLKIEEVKS